MTTETKKCEVCKDSPAHIPRAGDLGSFVCMCDCHSSLPEQGDELGLEDHVNLIWSRAEIPDYANDAKTALLSLFRFTLSQSRQKAVEEERARILKLLPEERIIHSYMESQNTGENRGWNEYRSAAIEAIINPKQ